MLMIERRTWAAAVLLASGWGFAAAQGATIYVDVLTCPLAGDGSVGNPYCSIQDGIDAATSGVDEVEVADGVYNENIDFNGKAIAVRSANGLGLATIDGSLGPDQPVVRCDSGEGANTVLDGFTITGALVSGNGGGMLISGSSPTVRDCDFVGNQSAAAGGGMSNSNGNPTIVGCTFNNNTAAAGGGMHNSNSHPTIVDCTFSNNTAADPTGIGGGGMGNANSHPKVTNCTFSKNTAPNSNGGGMSNSGSNPTVKSCSFSENVAGLDGGGMGNVNSKPVVTNGIFWENVDMGGMDETAQISRIGLNPIVNYSDVQGGWTGSGGTGNLDADPLFVNAAAGDLHLQLGSPCIDAGNDTVVDVSTDLDGSLRIVNCVVDMGAYEVQTVPMASVPADRDCDGDVDGMDFSVFMSCFNKAGNPPRTIGCDLDDRPALDFDDDGDVDGVDFSSFASCFNKAGNPPRTTGCPGS